MRTTRPNLKDIGLKATTLAVREEIVSYFKGGCVERFASASVNLRSTAEPSNYNYQRRQADITNPVKLLVGGVRLFNLSKEPNKIVFNLTALERSPQFRLIREAIEEVVDNYLMGVTKEYTGTKPNTQKDDGELVKDGQLRTKEDNYGERNPYEDIVFTEINYIDGLPF